MRNRRNGTEVVRADGDSFSHDTCWLEDKHANELSLIGVGTDNYNNKKMNLLHTSNLPPALPPLIPPKKACRGRHYHLPLDLRFKASLRTSPMTTKWLVLEPGTREAF